MTKSILDLLGREQMSKLMKQAVEEAHAANQSAGLVPAQAQASRELVARGERKRAAAVLGMKRVK